MQQTRQFSHWRSTSHRAVKRFLLVFTISAIGLPATIYASTYLMPAGTMEVNERIARSVVGADAICQAELVDVLDSSRPVVINGRNLWAKDVQLVLRPIAWLKGTDSGKRIRVGIRDEAAAEAIGLRKNGSTPKGIFFLRAAPKMTGKPEIDATWPHSPNVHWLLVNSPYGLALSNMVSTESATDPSRIDDELRSQSLDVLARSADVVVIGHPAPGATLRTLKDGAYALDVAVDSIIAGNSDSKYITIRSAIPDDFPEATTLIFLKKRPDGTYGSAVKGPASRAIRNGIVDRFGITLHEAVLQIRTASRKPVR